MLTETYVNTINNAEIEWKFARAAVVMKYIGTHPFIFPFNLVLYPGFLVYHMFFKKKMQRNANICQVGEADEEAMRQSGFLHKTIKSRFKERFRDVLTIPYHYRLNVFDFYKTFPFEKTLKKKIGRRVRGGGLKQHRSKETRDDLSDSSE